MNAARHTTIGGGQIRQTKDSELLKNVLAEKRAVLEDRARKQGIVEQRLIFAMGQDAVANELSRQLVELSTRYNKAARKSGEALEALVAAIMDRDECDHLMACHTAIDLMNVKPKGEE